jgi:hypothetical protein
MDTDSDQADPDQAARVLDRALALWRGPPYGEFGSGFAQLAAVRLQELRTAALEDRVELLLRRGATTDAVAEARDLVAVEPLRERRVALLMRALHADGRVAEALDAYRDHCRLLAAELCLDPPAGLRDSEQGPTDSPDVTVLLHGWPDSSYSFSRLTPTLAALGQRTLSIDQRGFGGSSRPPSGYRIEDLAEDAAAFLDTLDLPR